MGIVAEADRLMKHLHRIGGIFNLLDLVTVCVVFDAVGQRLGRAMLHLAAAWRINHQDKIRVGYAGCDQSAGGQNVIFDRLADQTIFIHRRNGIARRACIFDIDKRAFSGKPVRHAGKQRIFNSVRIRIHVGGELGFRFADMTADRLLILRSQPIRAGIILRDDKKIDNALSGKINRQLVDDNVRKVVEQQIENVLGADYVDIIIQAGPETGFLGAIRRTGNYAFMKCNWGADYADPETWTDPFSTDSSYSFIFKSTDPETQALYAEYTELVAAAKAITDDMDARYTAFAKAEAFLLDHAFAVPFSISNRSYQMCNLNVFEGQYASFGMANQRYKDQHLYDTSMGLEEYQAAYAEWQSKKAG